MSKWFPAVIGVVWLVAAGANLARSDYWWAIISLLIGVVYTGLSHGYRLRLQHP